MSRAILPGHQVRTSKQKARVGSRAEQASEPEPISSVEADKDNGEEKESAEPEVRVQDEHGFQVRLLRADANEAVLEITCTCGRLTRILLHPAQPDSTTSPTEQRGEGQEA